MKGKEWILAIVFLLVAVAFAVTGHRVTDYWQALCINLATTCLGLAAALVVLNVYLDLSTRKAAIRPLLQLVAPTMRDHQNALLDTAWNRFGKPQFKEIITRYTKNNGDPRALTPQERNGIYEMVKEDRDSLFARMDKLELELKELALLLGWSFKPGILKSSFSCRYAIVRLRAIEFDDSDQSKLDACEHFLDLSFMAHSVFAQLVDFIGLNKSDVYGE